MEYLRLRLIKMKEDSFLEVKILLLELLDYYSTLFYDDFYVIILNISNIKQKLENEFDNIKPKKDHYPIVFTVNDKFLDLLINIYLPNNTSENNEINEKINEINLNKNN